MIDDLDWASIEHMPRVRSLLIERGTLFANYLVNSSAGAPAQATVLRGQLAHNTEITGNRPPQGGFERFRERGLEDSTFATWLQAAGYQTAFLGRYLNGYPNSVSQIYVPPGWDEWASPVRGQPWSGANYTLNENGRLVSYAGRAEDYITDVMARKANDFIRRAAPSSQPFLLHVVTYAPHAPAPVAQRHQTLFTEATAPRGDASNEADVSDKPQWVRAHSPLGQSELAQVDRLYRRRLQSLQAVDEMVGQLLKTLEDTKQLDDTYFVLASDNGFHLGQHRLPPGKLTPYDEDIRVPLVVRGPGVPANRTVAHLTGSTDLAPTIAEWAGIQAPPETDGRSLAPLLQRSTLSAGPARQAFLFDNTFRVTGSQGASPARGIESGPIGVNAGLLEPEDWPAPPESEREARREPAYAGIRTAYHLYVEYSTGERELYDLRDDPFQLNNIYAGAGLEVTRELSARLADLRACSGEACQTAENRPFVLLH